ncbi:nuclease [Deinococcus sp. RL]|uniref:ExeM/NucH family extracellular endonuclease n=1 Tax=Deinococcus sp. RL TaxID=1489678 RepID=UPI0004D647F2|nr:ExeM/NucH family extracellular endonuclease [Deinococcus sp. RL]KEF33187.1 nuclease [Deinococcus sp. RL]
MTRPSRTLPKRLLLAGLLALAACGQAPQASLPSVPAAGAAPTRTPVRSLGLFELSVTGATTANPTATVRPAAGLSAQASEVPGLAFEPLSFGTFTDEKNGMRYLRATFRLTNGSGQALSDLALVPIDTEGQNATVGATPFRDVRYFDGSDASERAQALRVDTPRRLNSATGAVEPDPDATPLVGNLNTGDAQVPVPAGQQLAAVAHEGWRAGAVPAGGSRVVTFATRIPLSGTPARDPFAFRIVFTALDNPGENAAPLTNIAAVQGATPNGDAASPLAGQSVTVEGVVTAVTPGLSGFFLQEEGLDADGDAATSDGIFVFCGSTCPSLSAGDRVRVTAQVTEFRRSYTFNRGQPSEETVTAPFTLTQLTNAAVTVLAQGYALPAPVTVAPNLPLAERERLEGMRVTTTGVVTNNFPLGRFGSVDLAAERIANFTQVNAPSQAAYAAFLADLPNRTLRVDDGSTAQNPASVFGRDGQPLGAANTLRGGDTGTVTGVLHYDHDGFGDRSGSAFAYRVQAESALFQATNPRTDAPATVGGTLRVGSMNVLNYFTTLVSSNTGCTPNGTSSSSRGANTCDEFERQRAKIVAAITKLDPAVLGLLEIENDFDRGANSSVANLVAALNAATAPNTYAYVNPGAKVGTDAISVAMIYQPARVTPVGPLAILDASKDARYIDTCNRPTWAQTFQANDNGGRFTAVMAHLKSKGSPCSALNDADRGDGQGNAYLARERATAALVDWLATNPTGIAEDDRLIMGDLNAYAQETAVQNLLAGGYGNLFPNTAYSYQFDGQWGSLDHALASSSLRRQVTGQTKWHINADEPTVLDYNVEFKSAAQQVSLYAPDPFRSSDHDPVLVGLNLTAQAPITAPVASVALTPETAALTATVGGPSVSQSFTATGTNTTGPLTVTVTPQAGAPALASAPATVASGAPFDVTISAPADTAPGTYTYEVKAEGSGASDTSTLTVTVQGAASGPAFGTLVISQVYGGGGNSGAPYRSDFVELFNRGSRAVSLQGLTLQYASSAGAFTGTPFALPAATLQPGQYFLVKMADGNNTAAAPLPTPDASGTFAMSGTAGKVALVNNATPITGVADSDVIDFVGFGSANEREGAAPTPAPSNTTSALRKAGGCQDTNQNGDDFATGAPAPRNSASPLNVCN